MDLFKQVQKLIKPGGLLSEKIPDYEYRKAQEQMLENILKIDLIKRKVLRASRENENNKDEKKTDWIAA